MKGLRLPLRLFPLLLEGHDTGGGWWAGGYCWMLSVCVPGPDCQCYYILCWSVPLLPGSRQPPLSSSGYLIPHTTIPRIQRCRPTNLSRPPTTVSAQCSQGTVATVAVMLCCLKDYRKFLLKLQKTSFMIDKDVIRLLNYNFVKVVAVIPTTKSPKSIFKVKF